MEIPSIPEEAVELAPVGNVGGSVLNYLDSSAMNKAYKTATILSRSDLVPDSYKGRPENVLLAMDIASRIGASIMLVMQNLYVVKGKPGWSGQFCIAAINGCGKFSPLKFIEITDNGGGCYCTATRLSDGEVLTSPAVTMEMAKNEGWLEKSGSKWKTMPELMARYRAASFFAKTHCPEVLLGIQTVEEVRDVGGSEERRTVTVNL